MRTSIRSFVVLSLLGLIALLPVGLSANKNDANGVISGGLINGTTGERAPDVEVILQRYEGDQERDKQKTLSDAQGRFYFQDLDRSKGNTYALQVMYKDVEYYSPRITFDEEKQEIPLEMTVYETTDSDQKISIVMHHVMVEPKERSLSVRELMIVENRDNRVYVGAHEIEPDKKETLRISLPPRAQELQLLKGLMTCCIVQMQDGFADSMDIKPGKKEILFAYKVDYRASGFNLSKRINLTTDSLDFFIPEGIRAKGENIQYAGLIGEPEKQFLHFSGKKLAKGSQVALNLEGLPWGRRFFKGIVPILGVALMGLGLIYPLIRRRKRAGESKIKTEQESSAKSMLQEERQNILSSIAQLDDQMDSGQISPEEYNKKRLVLKERAIEATRTLQGMGE